MEETTQILCQILNEIKKTNEKLDAVTSSYESSKLQEDFLKWMKDNPPKTI